MPIETPVAQHFCHFPALRASVSTNERLLRQALGVKQGLRVFQAGGGNLARALCARCCARNLRAQMAGVRATYARALCARADEGSEPPSARWW